MSRPLAERRLAGSRALVTGASGFLGGALCRALLAAGVEVHALSRSPRSPEPATAGVADPAPLAAPNARPSITWHFADLTDPSSLNAPVAAARPDLVFHLAAYGTTYGQRDREQAMAVNVQGSLALWQALADYDVRLVATGTCGEYGDRRGPAREDDACAPTWFYPATKHAMVTLLTTLGRETGREVVVLRPFGPYGPGDLSDRILPSVAARLVAGETVETTSGEQLRDFLHVDDHVRGLLLAASRPLPATGRIYNLGSGRSVPLRQAISILAGAVGGDALGRVRFGALPYRSTEVWDMSAAIEAARRDLGFEPRIDLETGLRDTVRWHRERSRKDVP